MRHTHHRAVFYSTALATWLLLALPPANAQAQTAQTDAASTARIADNTTLPSLSDLADLEVTSVSKKSEKLSEAPAAVYVITQEDFRRSGATSIPEALRMVPGINVARAGAHQWAVTSRGFNDQFANKLLVLMDGRTLYTPLFSGVYWDVQDTALEDIERIEVIRGPGATLWGANAVNGVINIITKKAEDTQGALLSTRAGNSERSVTTARYGTKLNENVAVRGYAKYTDRDEERTRSGTGAGDDWHLSQGGFRAEWDKKEGDSVTLQGDAYHGGREFPVDLPSFASPTLARSLENDEVMRGANLLSRWNHRLSENSDTSLQVYWDYIKRRNVAMDESRHTLDVDFQHNWRATMRHDITWGLGYRLMSDDVNGSEYIYFTPESRSDDLLSAFVQDKITLLPDTLFLTLGSKFEHNDYSGTEFQPSARLAWLISADQTLWASVSRAVHTPDRALHHVSIALAAAAPPPTIYRFTGTENVDSEELIAYEIGYRARPLSNLSLDGTIFYNDYSKLTARTPGAPFFETTPNLGPHVAVPLFITNGSAGSSYGAELSANWEVTDYWNLAAGYSYIRMNISGVGNMVTTEGKTPQHQFNLRSNLNLPHDVEWDASAYYVDSLSGISIPAYLRLDTRLGWKPVPGLELSVSGQNLLDGQHPEFSPFQYQRAAEIGRSFYVNATWKF